MNEFLTSIFYRNNTSTRLKVFHGLIAVFVCIAAFAAGFLFKNVLITALGAGLLFYVFTAAGKAGAVIFGSIFIFANIVAILAARGFASQAPHIIMAVIAVVYIMRLAKFEDDLDIRMNGQELAAQRLDDEMVKYKEELERLKDALDRNRDKISKYKILNRVSRRLTSTLDQMEIVKVINEALIKIVENKTVKFILLVWDDETGMFYPAVEEKNAAPLNAGAVKIYRNDPFDDWLTRNKYVLQIKDVNDDLRFKTLRKDWINFRSMIAIPLIEGKTIIGILKFFSEEPQAFGGDDLRFLTSLGDICAAAVQSAILYRRTKELAIRDGLTGLYMRRYFVERLDDELRRSRETNTSLIFCLIDIDHFKDCNDTHGHLFGDKVLRLLGEYLKDNLRDVDLIGRYGGEEFAIALPNTNMNGGRFVAERLREVFSKLVINVNENEGIRLTLSIGGIECGKKMKLMDVINKADKALYYSKENGRNKVTFWQDISDEA
ncbi:MAG TPA: diguanylate cyclase [bacterium]|nr:diguanylate cyclase [bacterium]